MITAGNDPTTEVLEAVNNTNADCFINYRMNDHHNTTTDKENADNDRTGYPTHSAFWLENEDEYGVSLSGYRVLNYMAPHIRDHYFAILEELATNYIDYIDGLELDFDRYFIYFNSNEVSQGKEILSDFVARVRDMLNRLSVKHGKYLQLSVRIPGQTKKCDNYGIDAMTWDARGIVDLIGLSNHYFNTFDIDIEAFIENNEANSRARANINGEIHYNSYQEGVQNVASNGSISNSTYRRYLTREGYFATAQNFLSRGADGIHLFNVLYSGNRLKLYPQLAVLNDKEALAAAEKCYIMERSAQKDTFAGTGSLNAYIGFKHAKSGAYKLRIPENMSLFTKAVLKLEHDAVEDAQAQISVTWSSDTVAATELKRIYPDSVELFEPLASNQSYTTEAEAAFFEVPLELMTATDDIYTFTFESDKTLCSAELALYNDNIMSGMNPGFSQETNHMTVTDSGATVAITQSDASQDGDGYVLSVTNRTKDVAGGKFENVSFTGGKMYVVSAFAKLVNASDNGIKAKIRVEAGTKSEIGNEFELNSENWTRVFFYYDLTNHSIMN